MTEMSKECSYDKTERTCDYTCFACTLMHGLKGNGGLWATTGVPAKYKGSRISNLPTEQDNKRAYDVAVKYVGDILHNVQDRNIGLYLYSVPNTENPFGTGTGKTTTATAIVNEYLIARARQYLTGKDELEDNPAIFVKASELQNQFNAQFRGGFDRQEKASKRYYAMKDAVKKRELVVFDDFATRGSRISEAFEEELYEIIDYRSAQMDKGATIFTSNVAPAKLSEVVGERIASRVDGMAVSIGFNGSDKRKESLFK